MNSLHFQYVLVGGGAAGSAAAQAIRAADPAGSILLVGQEPNRPYLRPALSREYLRHSKSRMEVAIQPLGWFDQQKIELRTGRRVAHLDAARRAVYLDDGDEIAFDKLLLATGASPKPLELSGADLPNFFYLRTIQDCDRLHHAIDKAKSEGRLHPGKSASEASGARGCAAIIGNGLLAVEIASTLRQMGLHVELITGQTHVWGEYAGENIGRFIARYLELHGVIVHPNISPQRLEGDGRVQRLVLSNGQSLECDFVLAAVGIVPNRDLVRNTPIAAEKAILVDDHCRTNVPDIYAAGDCAAVFDPLFGKHRIIDHWESAQYTGAIAGTNMAGGDVGYDTISTFSSEMFELRPLGWGEPKLVDHRLLRGVTRIEAIEFAEIGVAADGRVAQVLAFGRDAEHDAMRELVRRRFNVEGHEELLKDPTNPISELFS